MRNYARKKNSLLGHEVHGMNFLISSIIPSVSGIISLQIPKHEIPFRWPWISPLNGTLGKCSRCCILPNAPSTKRITVSQRVLKIFQLLAFYFTRCFCPRSTHLRTLALFLTKFPAWHCPHSGSMAYFIERARFKLGTWSGILLTGVR